MADQSVTVLMPVYNEQWDRLNTLIQDILAEGYKVIIVDDGSIPPLKASFPGAVILRHESNLGQGAALETGMQYARQIGTKVLVHLDADGQHRIDEIHSIASPILLGQADIVFGSRFMRKSSVDLIPYKRRWQLRMAKIGNYVCTGIWMTDVHNGFRAMNQKALQHLHPRMPGREHASEIVYRTKASNLKYCEIAVHVEYHQPDQVNPLGIADMLRLFGNLIWARWKNYNMKIADEIVTTRYQTLKAADSFSIENDLPEDGIRNQSF